MEKQYENIIEVGFYYFAVLFEIDDICSIPSNINNFPLLRQNNVVKNI